MGFWYGLVRDYDISCHEQFYILNLLEVLGQLKSKRIGLVLATLHRGWHVVDIWQARKLLLLVRCGTPISQKEMTKILWIALDFENIMEANDSLDSKNMLITFWNHVLTTFREVIWLKEWQSMTDITCHVQDLSAARLCHPRTTMHLGWFEDDTLTAFPC